MKIHTAEQVTFLICNFDVSLVDHRAAFEAVCDKCARVVSRNLICCFEIWQSCALDIRDEPAAEQLDMEEVAWHD